MMQRPRAIIYTRVSTDKQAEEGTSLEVQKRVCLTKAREMGAEVVDIISDEGVSGAFYFSRPGIQKSLRLLEMGQANLLITMKLDRTGRDVDVIRRIQKRITNAGGRLIFTDGMNFENNATGKLILTQLAGFAEYEREMIRERCMSGRLSRAKQGQQPSRTQSPFGYHIITKEDVLRGDYAPELLGTYQIIEEEARIVRELFARCASGTSLRKLAKWLQSSGIPTQRGGKVWYPSTVRYLLANSVYKGQPIFGKFQWRTDEARTQKGLKPAYCRPAPAEQQIALRCEPLVDPAVWEACQARLVENPHLFSGPVERKHLLIGLLRCPTCGRCMVSEMSKQKILYYRCPESRPSRSLTGHVCNHKMHRGDVVEGIIIRDVRILSHRPEQFSTALRVYASKRRQVLFSAAEEQSLRSEIKRLETQEAATVKAQVDAIAKGRNAEVYDSLLDQINKQRRGIESCLAQLDMNKNAINPVDPSTDAQRIAEVLRRVDAVLSTEELTPAEKHVILASFLKAVRPENDGYSMELRSLPKSAQGLDSVQMISIH